jgi:cell division protein FtsW (lipid II flippase)
MKPKIHALPSFVPLALILGSIVGLAVMGLVFCWARSEWLHDIGRYTSRYGFNRQAIWNILGLTAFGLAIIVGWKRWLKAAPFVFVGWVALWFAAHMRQLDDGSSTIVLIGPISLEVWALFPAAFALLVAWLRQRYGVQTKRILFIVGIAAFAAITVHVVTNTNRMTHLAAFFAGEESPAMSPAACARAFVQSQTCKAFAQAQWFSSTDAEILRNTPGNSTYSMPASSAVMFGKWFMSLAGVFFAVIAFCFAWLWRVAEDGAKRAFILVVGLGIIGPAVFGVCQCLGIVPMSYTCVPLVSNCTTSVLASWLGAGILVSACVGKGEFVWSRAEYLSQ